MGKGNRNRVIRQEALKQTTEAGDPGRARSVARKSRDDLDELRRKCMKIRFRRIGRGGYTGPIKHARSKDETP